MVYSIQLMTIDSHDLSKQSINNDQRKSLTHEIIVFNKNLYVRWRTYICWKIECTIGKIKWTTKGIDDRFDCKMNRMIEWNGKEDEMQMSCVELKSIESAFSCVENVMLMKSYSTREKEKRSDIGP
jgi:hypothetical protein